MLAFEKEVLGFFLSDHPLKGYETLMKIWTTAPVAELPSLDLPPPVEKKGPPSRRRDDPRRRVVVVGLISELREIITKKGTRMAFARIEDLTGSCELVVFPDAYARHEMACREERPVLVAGQLEVEDGVAKIMVDSIVALEDMMQKAKHVVVQLHKVSPQDYPKLKSLLREHPGSTGVSYELLLEDLGRKVLIESKEGDGLCLSNEFMESIHSHFGRTDFIELRSHA